MKKTDKHEHLKEQPFSFKIQKDGKINIIWDNRIIKTIKGKEAIKFAHKLENSTDFEIQLTLAKLTGNFKRGNEK